MGQSDSDDTTEESPDYTEEPAATDASANWLLAENSDEGLGQIFLDYGIDPERKDYEEWESQDLARDLISILEGQIADVYQMRFVEHATSDEIAARLDLTLGQVRALEQQGINQMKAAANDVLRRRNGLDLP